MVEEQYYYQILFRATSNRTNIWKLFLGCLKDCVQIWLWYMPHQNNKQFSLMGLMGWTLDKYSNLHKNQTEFSILIMQIPKKCIIIHFVLSLTFHWAILTEKKGEGQCTLGENCMLGENFMLIVEKNEINWNWNWNWKVPRNTKTVLYIYMYIQDFRVCVWGGGGCKEARIPLRPGSRAPKVCPQNFRCFLMLSRAIWALFF